MTRATTPAPAVLSVKEIYKQGTAAYRAGAAVVDNPYTEPALRKVWLNGYFDCCEGKAGARK